MAQRRAPFHRAGAIDGNARYATIQADYMQMQDHRKGAVIYHPSTASNFQMSILVGEPLYTRKKSRVNDDRFVCVLSSLNSLDIPSEHKDDMQHAIDLCINYGLSGDPKDTLCAYSIIRDVFFRELVYVGFSLSVYDRAERMQEDSTAITHAGLNTIECDAPFMVGDIVIVDMPWSDKLHHTKNNKETVKSNPGYGKPGYVSHGLTACTRPNSKITLAVVPLPRRNPGLHTKHEMDAWVNFINGFYSRGQVVGVCTSGNKNGNGSIDVIMGTFPGGPI